MKNQKLQNLSGNSIFELAILLSKINNLINRDFCHVNEYLPNSLIKEINSLTDKVDKEIIRREDEF